jgi:hypothetical protein
MKPAAASNLPTVSMTPSGLSNIIANPTMKKKAYRVVSSIGLQGLASFLLD